MCQKNSVQEYHDLNFRQYLGLKCTIFENNLSTVTAHQELKEDGLYMM
jgi:hypothetical protein